MATKLQPPEAQPRIRRSKTAVGLAHQVVEREVGDSVAQDGLLDEQHVRGCSCFSAKSTEGLAHQVAADAGWPPSCSRLKLSLASEEAKQQWALRTR